MKANDTNILELLGISRVQYTVPVFQRTYSWGIKECRQLWEDIILAGSSEESQAHFLGSILYIDKDSTTVTENSALLIVDGQQRLTTVSLILEALARSLNDNEEPVSGFSSNKIRNYYLRNSEEQDDRRFKLILSETDKDSLKAIIDQASMPNTFSIRIKENFDYFADKINSVNNKAILCKGIAKLSVVDVALKRGMDNPQLIFESMNSKGLELSKADLIRNFVLMDLDLNEQNRLYQQYWRQMEEFFGQENYSEHFDVFIRHYLTIKSRKLPKKAEVYNDFKKYERKFSSNNGSADELLSELRTFSQYYCNIALKKEEDTDLLSIFEDLTDLVAVVSYPLVLEFYGDFRNGLLEKNELCLLVRLIESYVFRRAMCGLPPNSMDNTFASFAERLDKENYMDSVQLQFALLKNNKRFPDDEEFFDKLIKEDVYTNFKRRLYFLCKLENYGHKKEKILLDDYTIEHIMPQNPELSEEWQQSLGEDWKEVQNELLHTLGNLTLSGYNSEYSDKSFAEKRDMSDGFKESPLFLNKGLGDEIDWNRDSIIRRAEKYAKVALAVWPYPNVSQEILDIHSTEKRNKVEYSIRDHPTICANGKFSDIYTAIRREIMNLDSSVSEKFRKNYITYSFKRIFASVEPHPSGLFVYLYMPFHELIDPQIIVQETPERYHMRRAKAMLLLSDQQEIPNVMSLVRQAFRHQMDNED